MFSQLLLPVAVPGDTRHGALNISEWVLSIMCICRGRPVFGLDSDAVEDWSADAEQLADLLVAAEDIKAFLDGLAVLGASVMSRFTETRIECAVTLERRKRTSPIGGSSDTAMVLDRIEQMLGEGPCVKALTRDRPVLLEDALLSPQWREYCQALSAAGMRSTLCVPMELEQGASAVLNFFAPTPGVFSRKAVESALTFAGVAGKALRLAVRMCTAPRVQAGLLAPRPSMAQFRTRSSNRGWKNAPWR